MVIVAAAVGESMKEKKKEAGSVFLICWYICGTWVGPVNVSLLRDPYVPKNE